MLVRHILILCLSMLASLAAHAANVVVERSWVEDPTRSMTLAQVQAAPQTPLTGAYFGQGFSASAFWIRLRIDPAQWPEASPKTELLIRLRPVFQDEFQLHDPLSPNGLVRYSGDRHFWANDDYQSLNNNFVVPLGDAPRDIWLRLQTTTSTLSSIEVLDLKTARSKDVRQVVWGLIFLTVLLICAGWGILSWLNYRDKLVGLYVFREVVMILYLMTTFGVLRILGAELFSPQWIDRVGNFGFIVVGTVAIWFDIHFLKEYKPNPHLIQALYALLSIFVVELVIAALGYVGLALTINSIVLTLCFVGVFVTACTTRVWQESEPNKKPVLSKTALVSFYLFVLLIGVFNRLVAMGVISSNIDVWDLLLLYPLMGSLVMMAVLQMRSHQQLKLQQQAQWRLELAERSAMEEKSKRQEQQRFLAMLGHELRNPLSAVNFLADASTPEGQKIRRAVNDMSQVLERSIQAERFDDEGFKPHVEPVNVPELLDELQARAASARLQVHARHLPAAVHTDKMLLSIVLSNLVDNALKYSSDDSVVAVDVSPSLMNGQPCVNFRVANSLGPSGLPDTEGLFKKYYRNPAAQLHVGSGLGLYLVQGLLHMLGGAIEFTPDLQKQDQQVVFVASVPLAWQA